MVNLHASQSKWTGQLEYSLTRIKTLAIDLHDHIVFCSDGDLISRFGIEKTECGEEDVVGKLSGADDWTLNRCHWDVDERMFVWPRRRRLYSANAIEGWVTIIAFVGEEKSKDTLKEGRV
jgi:hypothetical protein